MNKDKTLGEKIKAIFHDQGITIVSILSVLGTIIGWVVRGTGTSIMAATHSNGGRAKDSGRGVIKD